MSINKPSWTRDVFTGFLVLTLAFTAGAVCGDLSRGELFPDGWIKILRLLPILVLPLAALILAKFLVDHVSRKKCEPGLKALREQADQQPQTTLTEAESHIVTDLG